MNLKKARFYLKKIAFSKWTLLFISLLITSVIASNIWVSTSTDGRIYNQSDSLPVNDVGLVLGTSKRTSWGGTNLYYKYRIRAAAELYKRGKIKHIIVSGDNSLKSYNEPRDMHNSLLELGVPSSAITLDFAGFRTFDSVVRCKEVFNQDQITIISQRFHIQRALFIADKFDIKAVGYAANDVPTSYSFKTEFREYLAKYKAVLDLYLLNKRPKFLGEKIKIPIGQE